MWEFFSLGKIPYPGVDAKQLICDLQNGYRMEKPKMASNEICRLMMHCWKAEPNDRPTFLQLEENLTKHLEASVCHHYVQISSTPFIWKLNQKNEKVHQ